MVYYIEFPDRIRGFPNEIRDSYAHVMGRAHEMVDPRTPGPRQMGPMDRP